MGAVDTEIRHPHGFAPPCRRARVGWPRRMLCAAVVLLLPLGVTVGPLCDASEIDPVRSDELLLKSAGLPIDGPGLVGFFRQRDKAPASDEQIAALIDRLAARTPREQEEACRAILAIGPRAVPLLRRAASDVDGGSGTELARRCLRALTRDAAAIGSAAARLLALRRPEGCVGVLLARLPHAEDEGTLEELRVAIQTVGWRDGQPDPELPRALNDPIALRRAVAIDALCLEGRTTAHDAVRKLLTDPAATVRLRAALALARGHDPRAVAVLVALLTELPPSLARHAEDFLQNLAGDDAPKATLGTDDAARLKCREAWSAWWEASSKAPLIEELRKRTQTDADRERAQSLIRLLGDDDFTVREKALGDLKAMGSVALPVLKQAVQHPDLEVRQRANTALDAIGKDRLTPLSPVTCRLIALRKPAGAVEAILAFLPFAEDDGILAELQGALNAVAYADGKPAPALTPALTDRVPARRAAAAEALCQSLSAESRPAVVKLLGDPDPVVRLKTALALAGARERSAIPTLIGLIGDLSAEQAAPAEDYLQRLAADYAPDLPAGDDPATRQRRRDAWAAWWQANGQRLTLVERAGIAASTRYLGHTLLVQTQTNQVIELGADGQPRWQLNNLAGPQDALVVAGDRVLVAEYNGQRVTERNLRGETVWQKQLTSWPVGVQRLPNGNTFVTCRNLLVEVDRRGREVFTHPRPANDIMSARKLRDGRVVCVSSNGSCFTIDAAGKELKSFRILNVSGHGNDVLPTGGILAVVMWQHKVLEYNADGKVIWEANVVQPASAHRLPNGNTLVATQQWPAKLIELDRTGRQVAEMATNQQVQRARRR